MLVDGGGIPLSLIVTGANRHDVSQLAATLDAVVVPRPPVTPRAPQHLCADAGFVGDPALHEMCMQAYTPHVRPRGEERTERDQGKRARRWVVEVAHSWFNRFRKLAGALREIASLVCRAQHARRRHHHLSKHPREGEHYLRISSKSG